MDKIVNIMKQILVIHPDLESHIHCLGFAITDEINGWKDMVEVLEEINCKNKIQNIKNGLED